MKKNTYRILVSIFIVIICSIFVGCGFNSDGFCKDIFGEYGNAEYLRAMDVPKANSDYYELTVEDMIPDPIGGYNSKNRFIVRVRKDATVNYLTWNYLGEEVYTKMTLDEYAQELGYKDFSRIEYVRIWLVEKTKQDKEGYIMEFVDGPFG